MAAEAACPAQAAPHRHRRANQDYSACNLFLSAEMWLKLGSDRSERNKAEELAEFLFSYLGLRLPTEPTYATMTALVCSSTSPSRFELHSALQVVKSSWRSLSTRMLKISKEDKKAELLHSLPARWEDLPERLRSLWGDVRPAGCTEARVSESAILRLAAKVPLRETDGAIAASKAQPQFQQMLQIVQSTLPTRSPRKPDDGLLKNLKIYRSPNQKGAAVPSLGTGTASVTENNLMSKLSLQGCMEGSSAANKMLALEAPCSSNPHASDRHGGKVVPVGQTSRVELPAGQLCRVETASSFEEDLGNGMPAGQPAHGPDACLPAGQRFNGVNACVPVRQQASAPAGHVSDGTRNVNEPSAPASVLRSQAQSFLQARGADPAGKGTKRKASETSLKKRPASSSSQVRKTVDAPVLKRPSASKATLKQVAVPDVAVKKQWANRSFDAKQWGHCRVEFYSAKSYIRFFCEKKNRLCMVIGSVHGQHQEICDRLVPHVQKGKSREKLLEIRAQLERSVEGKDV